MKKLIVAGLITLIGIVYTLGFYSGWNLDKADIIHVDSLVYDCPGYDDLIQKCDEAIELNIELNDSIEKLSQCEYFYYFELRNDSTLVPIKIIKSRNPNFRLKEQL